MVDIVTAKCMHLMNGEAGWGTFPMSVSCNLLTSCSLFNVLVLPELRMEGDQQLMSFVPSKPDVCPSM